MNAEIYEIDEATYRALCQASYKSYEESQWSDRVLYKLCDQGDFDAEMLYLHHLAQGA